MAQHDTPERAGHEDPDPTDELPQFDPAAYEAHLAAAGRNPESTDTWIIPQPLELHVARIAELERELEHREVELHVLRGNLEQTTSTKTRLDSELNGILETIAHLEARLAEAQADNESLEARARELETAVTEQQQRAASAEREITQLNEERLSRIARIDELEKHVQTERAVALARTLELEHVTTTAGEATQAMRHQLEQLTQELQRTREAHLGGQASIVELRTALDAQTGAAAEIARRFAEQYSLNNELTGALEVTHAAIGKLEQAVVDRDARVAGLETRARATAERIASLEAQLAGSTRRADGLADELAQKNATIAGLQETLSAERHAVQNLRSQLEGTTRSLSAAQSTHERQADELSVVAGERDRLSVRNAELDREITTLRNALAQREIAASAVAAALAERQGELAAAEEQIKRITAAGSAIERELAQVREHADARIAELAAGQNDLRSQLNQQSSLLQAATAESELRDARMLQLTVQLSEQRARIETLTQDNAATTAELHERSTALQRESAERADRDQRILALQQQLTAAQERISALENELARSHAQSTELSAALAAAQGRADSTAGQLAERDKLVATLQSDIDAHAAALSAIRRDVNRIESSASRPVEPSAPTRYLIDVDAPDVMHVLNRKVMTIGRTSESDLQVRSSLISRLHARLLVGNSAVILEDLGSTNGCYINGRRVRKQLLQHDDVLMIGKTRFRFVSRAVEAATH